MAVNRNIHTILIISTLFLFNFLFCTDPAKPDFNEGAKLTDKQIHTQEIPALDSLFRLYVSAEGTAPLLYQWYKNSVAISNAKDDTLTFDALSLSDSGSYQCIVWNDYGSDTSLVYTLQVFSPPSITTPNKNILTSPATPVLDSSFFMYISATGSDTLKYQWYLNSSPKTGANNDTLSFTTLTNSDTGVYQCIVTNNWGADTSLIYNLSFSGNHPPDWVKDTITGTAKEMITYKLVLSDSCTDPDNDTITFSLGAGTPAGDSIADDSIYTYTPTFDDAGVYHINLWAKDGTDSSLAVLKLTVLDSNRAPEFKDSLPLDLYRIQEGEQLTISFEAEDPDGDTAIVFLDTTNTTLPRKETIVFTNSQLVWQSNSTDSGAFSVVLGATDNVDVNYFNITVTVNDVNLPPEISITGYQNGDNVQITEGVELAFTVSVDDPDTGQTPVLTSPVNIPTGATFDTASGGFSYTPDFSVSNKQSNTTFSNVTFYATDNMAARAIDSFVIHIIVLDSNRAPECIDTNLTVNEEATTPINIFATDHDGDAMTWDITQGPKLGSVDNTTGPISNTAVEFNYTANNLTGNSFDTIQVRIEDGVTQCIMSLFITIQADNDPPVITQAPPVSAVEDNTTDYPVNIAGHDPESTAVKWYIHKIPKKGNLDKLEGDISAGIEMLYTLKPDSCGKDTLTFYLLDEHNVSSDTQAIIVTIDSLNDAPVIQSQITTPSCDEDNDLTLQLSYLTVTDVDNAAGDLSLVVLDDANYSVVSGTTIRPDQDYNGSLTVKVQVSDGKDSSIVFDMSATVNPINDKPEITNLSCPSSVAFKDPVNFSTSFIDADGNSNIISITYIIDSQVDFTGAPGASPHPHSWTAPFGPYVIGPHYITVIIEDADGEKDTAQAVVTVTGTLISDTLSVRAILDSNNNNNIQVDEVTETNAGRISLLRDIIYGNPPFPVPLNMLPAEIGNLSNLSELLLDESSGELSNLPAEIGKLHSLTRLILRNNKVSNLPSEIGNLTNLTELVVSSNQLTSLPLEIESLSNLTTIELNGNLISSFPLVITRLSNLQNLSINNNQLSSLPVEIGNLANLQNLNLSANNLSSLPTQIGNLSNLQTLSLYDNQLTSIPSEIGNLGSLIDLEIRDNAITVLPGSIGGLSELELLHCGNNQLSELPPEICNLITLQTFRVLYNQLEDLPDDIVNLVNLTGYRCLDLGYNKLPTNASPPEPWEQWADSYDSYWRNTQSKR